LFVVSIPFLLEKNALGYFLCIGIASLFHRSALILLPVFLLAYANWRINVLGVILIAAVFVSLFFLNEQITPCVSHFIEVYFEDYKTYEGKSNLGSGLGLIYSFGLLFLTLYFERFQERSLALIFKLAVLSFMFIPLGFVIHLIGRVGWYFGATTIIVFPFILMSLQKYSFRVFFVIALLFMTLYSFVIFFSSEGWSDYYSIYHSVFSAPEYF
jgi:hypothetical protein